MVNTSTATVCIVPRERFSVSVRSLENVLARTPPETPMVYVDGNSPPGIAERLEAACARRGAQYLREERFLSPNEARAWALEEVATPYLVFLDNDVFVGKRWLEPLLECAESTGAWAVSPLILEGSGFLPLVHMAGGTLDQDERDGFPTIRTAHRLMRRLPMAVRRSLRREPCGLFEFHGVLLRRECFERGCSLDPALSALHEHIDLAMQIHRAGGSIYFEPASIVRYDNATPFDPCDRAFFAQRWCDAWTGSSIEHFREKWGFSSDDPGLAAVARFARAHSRLFEYSHQSWLRRALPLIARREGANLLRRWRRPSEA
jgi:hypothetical protein